MSETVTVKVLKPHDAGAAGYQRRNATYTRDRGEANELKANGIVEIVDQGLTAPLNAPEALQGKAEPAVLNKAEPVPQNKTAQK